MEKKEISRSRVAIIGIGFVLGLAMLVLGGRGETEAPKSDNPEEYRSAVESELEELCRAAVGGDVRVYVSLDGGFSYGYALDSRGGVITVGSGGSERAVVESVEMPSIGGVGMVFEGDCDENELLELVSSALGIGKNKIFITNAKKRSSIS